MTFYHLKTNEYIEINNSNKGLKFLYNNIIGRIILKIILIKPIRFIYEKYMNSKLSRHKIKKFIKNNNINMNEYENHNYKSFNDFFIRKIKKDKRKIDNGLVAVSDSKLTAYKINKDSTFNIKDSIYTIEELINEKTNEYNDGYALIFRLSVDDYHHYIFPDDGKIVNSKEIKGKLHTVQPIAFKKYKVFHENTRVITFLDCNNYGNICYIEVGAMMIGKITNEDVINFKKGDEKGHFEFGGSTIILLLQKDTIKINEKILENSQKGIETIVKLGERIE